MDFVTFDIAKKLKEKGFKEKCYAYYLPKGSELIFNHTPFRGSIIKDCLYSNNSLPAECIARDFIDAPTISQVLKWLRETKNIEVVASFSYRNKVWGYQVGDMTLLQDSILSYDYSFPTYEEAALAGIQYVINNLI